MKLPVSCTNIASVVGWNATAVDDYSKDDEACAGDDLEDTECEFDLLQLAHSSGRPFG
jgi:hypothetical protein